MAERKMRYAVLTHFAKYSSIGNKAMYQWDADGLLESYSYEEIKDVIDYAAGVNDNLAWKRFVYDFDDYRTAMIETQKDRAARKRNLDRLRKWMGE